MCTASYWKSVTTSHSTMQRNINYDFVRFAFLELCPAKSSVYPGTADFHSSPTRSSGAASCRRDYDSCTRAASVLTASKKCFLVNPLIGCISCLSILFFSSHYNLYSYQFLCGYNEVIHSVKLQSHVLARILFVTSLE